MGAGPPGPAISLTNVTAQSITITGVSNGASAQDIIEEIRNDLSLLSPEKLHLNSYRALFPLVIKFVDALRPTTSSILTIPDVELVSKFLDRYISSLRTGEDGNALELVEVLTTYSTLHRLYGQYYLIVAARAQSVSPITMPNLRVDLVAQKEDKGHLYIAETFSREAIRKCEASFGPDHPQLIFLKNELGLLHRDRGEYKQAAKLFADNVNVISNSRPSDKRSMMEAYTNWSLTFRDRASHVRSAYLMWSASVFSYSSPRDRPQVLKLYKEQLGIAAFYFVAQIIFLAILIFVSSFFAYNLWMLVVDLIIWNVMGYFWHNTILNLFLMMPVVRLVSGREAMDWPSPREDVLLKMTAKFIAYEAYSIDPRD